MSAPRDLYPISEKAPEMAVSASGMPLERLTLEAVVSGEIGPPTSAYPRMRCACRRAIARDAGRDRLALNLERAAELVDGSAGCHP